MNGISYKYYNQNNYANIPYPNSELPKATIKSGGCGVCCGAMIISNMTNNIVDPIKMATYSINKKARVSGGTDMNVLAKSICADYGLNFVITNDENKLFEHLKSGGMAVANVGGDRNGYIGVFSNGGHFIVIAGLTSDGKIIVLDPGYYTNKFNITGRKGKVTVSGNNCVCDISVLTKDTENRSPAYWLFSRKEVIVDMKIGMEIPEVKVLMNNKQLEKTIILNVDGKDTTYIPAVVLRDIGINVSWDDNTKTVIITK